MIAVKVEYTVKADFVEENKANISKVMEALKKQPIDGMFYSSQTVDESPATFIHINMAKSPEIMGQLNALPEFKAFQSALKASEPVVAPKATKLTVVGKGF